MGGMKTVQRVHVGANTSTVVHIPERLVRAGLLHTEGEALLATTPQSNTIPQIPNSPARPKHRSAEEWEERFAETHAE